MAGVLCLSCLGPFRFLCWFGAVVAFVFVSLAWFVSFVRPLFRSGRWIGLCGFCRWTFLCSSVVLLCAVVGGRVVVFGCRSLSRRFDFSGMVLGLLGLGRDAGLGEPFWYGGVLSSTTSLFW